MRDYRFTPSVDVDALPPFALLTNDDDRELKATGRKPGTYNLVCVPDSFTNASADEDEDGDSGMAYSGSTPPASKVDAVQPVIKNENFDLGSDWRPISNMSPNQDDPEVVILKRFEEPSASRRTSLSVPAPTMGHDGQSKTSSSPATLGFGDLGSPRIPFEFYLGPQDSVARGLAYHRKFIGPRLARLHDNILSPSLDKMTIAGLVLDPFESESIQFPPVSAFSASPISD